MKANSEKQQHPSMQKIGRCPVRHFLTGQEHFRQEAPGKACYTVACMKRILRTRVAALVLGTAGFVFAGCASAPTGPRPQQGTQAVQPEPSADASDADGGKQESPSPAEPESPVEGRKRITNLL